MNAYRRPHQPARRTLTAFFILLVALSLACSLPQLGKKATPAPALPTAAAAGPTAAPTPTAVPQPPTLLETDPLPGAEIPLDAPITLHFNQPMERGSVEAALRNNQGLAGSFEWLNDATVKFQPAASLPPASSLTLTVDTVAQSKKGLKLLSPVDVSFQTAGFLSLAQTLPEDGASEIDPASAVIANFNHPVVPLGADPASLPAAFTLEPAVAGHGEWINTSTYSFKADLSLGGGVTYAAQLNPDLLSTDGAPLGNTKSAWTFTVALPYPISFEPGDTSFEVPLDASVKVVFNQSMDASTTQANFSLLDEQLQPVQGQFGWDEKFTTMWFTPTQLLERDSTYTAQLLPGAASAGGKPLDTSYRPAWQTVPAFFVTSTDPQDGGSKRTYGNISLTFSSFIQEGDLTPFISVTPPVSNLNFYPDANGKQLYVGGDFLPETFYTVRADSTLGDRWGATLAEPFQFTFFNGPLDPMITIPVYQDVIFLTPQDRGLPAQVSSLSQIPVNVGSLSLIDLLQMLGPNGYDVRQNLVPEDTQQWQINPEVSGSETRLISIPLTPDGGPLNPGLYLMRLPVANLYAGPFILVVSNIQITYKISASDVFVWAVDLRSDTPAAGLPVMIYLDDGQMLTNGETDAQGVFRAPIPAPAQPGQSSLAVVGFPNTDTFGVALSTWDQMVAAYNFGINMDVRPPRQKTYIYTDRPIYRPGQTVYYRMIARKMDNGRYFPPEVNALKLKIFDGIGTELREVDLPLSALGTASGEFKLSPDAQPGYYRLEVGDDVLNFMVAEYRKPEINLEVTAAATQIHYGDTLQATVSAQYFFGAPASGAVVDWALYSRTDRLYLPGYEIGQESTAWLEYFSTFEGYYAGLGPQIAQGNAVIGPDGTLQLAISTIPEQEFNTLEESPLQYTLEVTVKDESGQFVSARTTVQVHREDYYIGIRPDAWVARAGQETGYQVQVVDWNADPAGERTLRAEYNKVTWTYQRSTDRYLPPQPVASYTPVGSVDFTTAADGTARLAFTPPEPGIYQISVQGGEALTTLLQWVGGPGQAIWPNLPNQRLRLTTDRPSYQPGETAQVFAPNPFGQPAQALLTLERGKVMYYELVTLPAEGGMLPVKLTEDAAPNVYFSLLLLGRTQSGTPDFRVGYLNLEVAPVQQLLNVSVAVQPERAGPGDTVSLMLRVTDSAGSPVQGEFSLAVVDLAVLKLADPFAADIDQAFYGQQPLGVHTSLSLAAYGGREVFTPGGMGGGGSGEEVAAVREEFPDTAYWNPALMTDGNGEATVSLALPDSLTTWEFDLRGITAQNQVGQAKTRVVTSKDLLVRPVTPRFLVVGDRVMLAAIVQNNTTADLSVEAGLQGDGFVLEGSATQTLNVEAGGRARVEWWGVVQDVETLDLIFTARGGGLEDASRPANGALPVLRYRAPQAFATAGVLEAAGERLELVSLPSSTDLSAGARAGGLRLQLAPSLGAAAYDALEVLNNYPYECTEQALSRLLGNLATLQAARTANLQNPQLTADLEGAVLEGLSLIVSRQGFDGGWGWWINQAGDVHISSYAVMALVQARQAGFTINEFTLQRGVEYLLANLNQPDANTANWELDRLVFSHYALTLAGSGDAPVVTGLYEDRARLSPWSQALLALALEQLSPGSERARTLFSDLQSTALRSGSGANWEDSNQGYRLMASAVSTTAIVAYALVQSDPNSALLPDVMRYIMVNRQANGAWYSTYETAWVLMALNEWVQATGDLNASFSYDVTLNGLSIASGQASAAAGQQSEQVAVPLSQLYPSDPNALLLQRGEGPGRLYYTAILDASRPVAEVAPLNRGLTISREFYLPGQEGAVQAATAGQQVTVRLHLVVPHEAYYVVVEDYIPAGAEVINSSLKTSQQGFDEFGQPLQPTAEYDPANPFAQGWGWWLFGPAQIFDDHIAWLASYLPAGTYELTYRLSTLQPGEYRVLPAHAYQFYFPDVQGNSAGAIFEIQP